MSKTYKDSRKDKNRRDENFHKRLVKDKAFKRQNKFKKVVEHSDSEWDYIQDEKYLKYLLSI